MNQPTGMRSCIFIYAGIACLALWLTSAFAVEQHPNVLFIVSDDQRPDTVAALGNPIIKTPALARLVRDGTTFTRATCANPICTPSRAEILTGQPGPKNGVFGSGRTIDPRLPTLPEPFAAVGYQTWYCGKWHNNGRPTSHGYQRTKRLFTGGGAKWWKATDDYRGHPVSGYRGWIFRDEDNTPLPELGVGLQPEISATIADAAIAIIRDSKTTPFFIHLNFTAPHDPLLIPRGFQYDPVTIPLPKNFAPTHPFDHGNEGGRDEVLLPVPRTADMIRADLAAYYAVISHMDAQVGRILDALDESKATARTIVVFTSDHGLAMGSHGLRGKQNMYEHTIGVPLIFAGPGVPKGETVAAQVTLRDLFPTLCEMSSVPVPKLGGQSLWPLIQGSADSVRDEVIGYFRDSQRMIRTDRWKYIEYRKVDRIQLFDLTNDPHELTDLSADKSHLATRQELKKRMDQWFAENQPPQ